MTKEADKLEKLCEIDRLKRSFSDDEIDFTIAENQNKYISDSLEGFILTTWYVNFIAL